MTTTTTTTVFPAERRDKFGKGPARALRRASKIPAIVLGGRHEPLRIAMPVKEIRLELSRNPRFFSTVFELDLGEDGGRLKVLPREAQLHPVTDEPLHVDFLRAEAGATITVDVPVRFVHEDQSPGLKRGGVLNVVRRTLELACPADAIPGEVVVDLAGREIGDSVHISQIALPPGVRPTITDRDFTVCSVVPPTVVAEQAPAAGGEAAPAVGS
jgi:large subunit ribosomal protein L25